MGMDACVDFQVILRQILLEAAWRYYYTQFSNLNEGRTTKNKKVKSILSQLSTYAGTMPGSTLKKKNNAIAYHHVREGVARDEYENVADLLTKPLSGPKRWKFVRMVLHHIYPEKEI